jgi:hypothetical protein
MNIHQAVSAAVLVAMLMTGPASAQVPRASGPFTGLFGGRSTSQQQLDTRGSAFGAWQKSYLPAGATPDPYLDLNGESAGVAASLAYQFQRAGEGSSFFFGSRGSGAYLSARPDDFPWDVTASTGLSTQLSQRSRFFLNADAGYSPYYGFPTTLDQGYTPTTGFGQDSAIVGQPGFDAVLFEPTVNYGGNVGLDYRFTQRTTLTANADVRRFLLLDRPDFSTRSYSAGAFVRHEIGKGLGVRGGYRRWVSSSETPGTERLVSDSLDAGLDYAGSLALDRRTTVTFGAFTSIYRTEGESQYRVNGNAGITREIGRSWSANAYYTREVNFVVGFTDPVLSDTVSARVGGLVAPRLSSSTYVTWQRGEVGFDTGQFYENTSASTALQFALTRTLALYANYSYFWYETPPPSVTLPFYDEYERQIVSAGLTAYLPIFRSGRADRDSR